VASATMIAENMLSYLDEQRKLEQLQREFRVWLETKEDIVRLADKRDQLLAILNAKYGYRTEVTQDALAGESVVVTSSLR
jgi:hypothetical protein